jgi:hypothetical protein
MPSHIWVSPFRVLILLLISISQTQTCRSATLVTTRPTRMSLLALPARLHSRVLRKAPTCGISNRHASRLSTVHSVSIVPHVPSLPHDRRQSVTFCRDDTGPLKSARTRMLRVSDIRSYLLARPTEVVRASWVRQRA